MQLQLYCKRVKGQWLCVCPTGVTASYHERGVTETKLIHEQTSVSLQEIQNAHKLTSLYYHHHRHHHYMRLCTASVAIWVHTVLINLVQAASVL